MFEPPNLAPDERQLRQFGFFATVAFPALAALVWTRGLVFSHLPDPWSLPLAAGLLTIGLASLALSLLAPRLNRPLWVLLILLSYPIGVVVSSVALLLIYYGVLTPIGVVRRRLRPDPLGMRIEADADSYWRDGTNPKSSDDYYNQF